MNSGPVWGPVRSTGEANQAYVRRLLLAMYPGYSRGLEEEIEEQLDLEEEKYNQELMRET